MSYHIRKIDKGILGHISKVQEELHEYEDAMEQGSTIMAAVELSDLYGALEAVAEKHNLTMDDLKKMAHITKRAFQSGHRK